ncbi:MAG: MotA/TolQ/ExbB proton channel family protein [Acidiferrobacteraceae bacterium]
MLELIKSGGWVMWPLIACSISACAIIGERLWSLQRRLVVPSGVLGNVQQWLERGDIDGAKVGVLRRGSPLGRVLAAGLVNRNRDRALIKEAIEDAGRHVALDLERYLNALGTIAAVAPFLGLLGTVLGMIRMFAALGATAGDPAVLARGISQALVTTASGLTIAIPSLIFYRYFRGRVRELLTDMEQQALHLVDLLHSMARAGRGAA